MELLALHNRPFNAQSVADFLAPAGVKKPACQKALDSLAEAGRLTSKEFGKSKLYWLPQAGLQARAGSAPLRRRPLAPAAGTWVAAHRPLHLLTRIARRRRSTHPERRFCPRRRRTPNARR